MHGSEPASQEQPESFDEIARDLRILREDAGPVSYAELVRRITELRLRRGATPAAAIPARSTVYNAFKTGRSRMDTELLRDIVVALGEDEDAVSQWLERCRNARKAASLDVSRERFLAAAVSPRKLTATFIALCMVTCVVVNLLGLSTTAVFKLSVYLDMVGTAIAALVLGPWHGVAVAIASNGLGFLTGDLHTLEFTPVNVVGALVWGYGVRKFRLGDGLPRFVTLSLLTALACSLVAAPIVAAVFHGGQGHASEQAVLSLEAMQIPFAASVFSTNIVTSVMDKLLTGFIALAVFVVLHRRTQVPAHHMPLVERIGSLRTESGRNEAPAPRLLTTP